MFSVEGVKDLGQKVLNPVETFYYEKFLGVRKEYSELNPLAVAIFLLTSTFHTVKHISILEGYPLPKSGAAILTGNHHRDADIYKGCILVRHTAHRLGTRAVVRKSLIDPESRESEEYLKKIGNKQDDLNKPNPMRAFVLRGLGVIPIPRDNPGHDFVKKIDEVLKSHQISGLFLQETRNEDCLLRNLQTGAAFFARRHPDVPVYPLAFSGPPDGPDKVTALKPFTYAEISNGEKISVGELTIMIADMIASALPQRVQKDWETRRPEEFQRLTPPKKINFQF